MVIVRVGFIAEQLLAPVPGGIGRTTAELGKALAQTAAAGDEVHSWTAWHANTGAASLTGVSGPRRLPLGRRALSAAWERGVGPGPHRIEVIYAPSLLAPPTRRRPTVVMIHDCVPWTHPRTLTPRGARWHRLMAERVVRTGAFITTPTRVVADELLTVLPALSADRVRVMGGGVSPALLDQPSAARMAEVRQRLALPGHFLLTLATLEPRKGLDVLVQALGRLGSSAPPLLVVGQPGWGGVDLAGAAGKAGLAEGAVRELGRIGDADLAVVLRAAAVLVSPSRAEGFGLPVAEAMAVGTAVICSDAPALAEVAADAALVVPRGEVAQLAAAIEAVAADEQLRARMSAAGFVQAKGYRWAAVAERTWDLCRELLSSAHR